MIDIKRLVLILAIINLVPLHVFSLIVPNPIISRGKSVYTSSGMSDYLVNDKFNSTTWNVENNSWIAIKVDSGPTKVLFNWNNPSYPWSNDLSPSKCPNSILFPVNYNILTSTNSTNGSDGDWVIADSIRGNLVSARCHIINFTGASWVKMAIITGGGTLDQVEVFDVSAGAQDSWLFAGTSITANAFKGTPPAQDYADLVHLYHSDYNPVMVRAGIGCITSTNFADSISRYLQMANNVHYWAIEMGTNDAWGGGTYWLSTFINNMQIVIDSCKAYGIQPIIARIIATDSAIAGWQVNPLFLAAVDSLTAVNNLIAGPDFYSWFKAHPGDIMSNDGIHPNATGAADMQKLWAQKMDSLYGGCQVPTLVPYIRVNKGALVNISDTTISTSDTVTLKPQASTGGTWSWSGPKSFSAASDTIAFKPIISTQGGNYIATLTNGGYCSSTCTFTLTVTCKSTQITPYLKINQGDLLPIADTTVYIGDTISLSPQTQASVSGTWLWSGPYFYGETPSVLDLSNIQTYQSGQYVVYFNGFGYCECSDTFKLNVVKNPHEGVNSLSTSGDVTIFPNPTNNGDFFVKIDNLNNGAQIQICDVRGTIVYKSALIENETEINSGLAKGIYFVKIINGKDYFIQKLINVSK
jgi:lysophospholipase L1-like esterase